MLQFFIMKTIVFFLMFAAFSLAARPLKVVPELRSVLPCHNLTELFFLPEGEAVGPIISVEIGRKKFNCQRFGFCRGSYDPNIQLEDLPAPTENKVFGTGYVIGEKLTLEFYRKSMTFNTYETYFGGDKFIVEEDFQLPDDVSTALGVKSYTIKAGIYPIIVLDNNNLLVNF